MFGARPSTFKSTRTKKLLKKSQIWSKIAVFCWFFSSSSSKPWWSSTKPLNLGSGVTYWPPDTHGYPGGVGVVFSKGPGQLESRSVSVPKYEIDQGFFFQVTWEKSNLLKSEFKQHESHSLKSLISCQAKLTKWPTTIPKLILKSVFNKKNYFFHYWQNFEIEVCKMEITVPHIWAENLSGTWWLVQKLVLAYSKARILLLFLYPS